MKGKNYKLTVALLIHTMMVEEKMNKKINDLRIQHCKVLYGCFSIFKNLQCRLEFVALAVIK